MHSKGHNRPLKKLVPRSSNKLIPTNNYNKYKIIAKLLRFYIFFLFWKIKIKFN